MNHRLYWERSLQEAQQNLETFIKSSEHLSKLESISAEILKVYRNRGNVFTCGNGGSHCDAMHFAEELTGRYRKDRIPLGALALGDPSHVTCVGNDYGFDQIFARQLQGLARPNDLLLIFSTSGNSKNLIAAIESAKKIPIKTVAILGRTGGLVKELSDTCLIVPGNTSDRIQELHIKIIHILIEIIERELFPQNYES